MRSAEVGGNSTGVVGLVKGALSEADGEGADRLRRLRLHQGYDSGGIDPARKERTQWHIGKALPFDRARQQPLQFVGRLPFIGNAACLRGDDLFTYRPVGPGLRHRARRDIGGKGYEGCGR